MVRVGSGRGSGAEWAEVDASGACFRLCVVMCNIIYRTVFGGAYCK